MNQKNSPQIEEVLQEKDSEKQKEKYNEYVSNITPKSNRFLNWGRALTASISTLEMIRNWQDFTRHYH